MFIFINISLIIFSIFHTDKELIFLLAALNLLPVFTYVLNSMGFYKSGRMLLSVLTPLSVLLVIVFLKKMSPYTNFNVSEYHFYTPRYYLLMLCLIPLFLIDFNEKKIFISALIINVICILSFDFMHNIGGVGYKDFGFEFEKYYQATIMPVVLLFFLYGSILFYKYENKKYEEKILQLKDELKEFNDELEEEIELAKNVVEALLPKHKANIKGYEVEAGLKWFKDIGGDFYTYHKIDDSHDLLFLADVSGKGVAGSVVVSIINACLETHLTKDTFDLENFLLNLNKVVFNSCGGEKYVTAWCGLLNHKTGTLKSINSGHPPPIVVKENGSKIVHLKAGSTIIGFFDDEFKVSSEEIQLEKGDLVFAYTDGITEAQNDSGEFFEQVYDLDKLLSDTVREKKSDAITVLIDKINVFTNGKYSQDDMTYIAVSKKSN